MKYEAIFFDWDGVITDSVSVKTDAFCEMFKAYGSEIQEKVREHHLLNGGMSRYDKLRLYYREFIGEPIDEEKVHVLAQQFSQLVKEKVIKAAFIPGAVETIQEQYRVGTKLFVVSGTPTTEMDEIVDAKGLRSYFSGIGGSPQKKVDWVNHFCGIYNLNRKKCLFIGDALADYNAAQESGIGFIGVKISSCRTLFPEDTSVKTRVIL